MKPKRTPIPQTEVLDWLKSNHPDLHASAAIDRSWVWLTANPANDAEKEAITKYGFVFSKKGGHRMTSGKLGLWAHSCTKPTPFKFKGKGRGTTPAAPEPEEPNEVTEMEDVNQDEEAKAFAEAYA